MAEMEVIAKKATWHGVVFAFGMFCMFTMFFSILVFAIDEVDSSRTLINKIVLFLVDAVPFSGFIYSAWRTIQACRMPQIMIERNGWTLYFADGSQSSIKEIKDITFKEYSRVSCGKLTIVLSNRTVTYEFVNKVENVYKKLRCFVEAKNKLAQEIEGNNG